MGAPERPRPPIPMGSIAKIIDRLFGGPSPSGARRAEEGSERRWTAAGGRLEVRLFAGEIVDAPAQAIATSTNPRLSLGGGTGRAVLGEAGWALRRELEAVVEGEANGDGDGELPVGFTCATAAGEPPHELIVHCVASDRLHRSSPEAARLCTEGALREAARAGCASLALPVFGTGHADLPFGRGVEAMAAALREADPGSVETVLLVVHPPERAPLARQTLDRVLHPGGGAGPR